MILIAQIIQAEGTVSLQMVMNVLLTMLSFIMAFLFVRVSTKLDVFTKFINNQNVINKELTLELKHLREDSDKMGETIDHCPSCNQSKFQ